MTRTPGYMSAYMRQYRGAKVRKGLCLDCRAEAEPGMRRCAAHLKANRERVADWKRRRREAAQ